LHNIDIDLYEKNAVIGRWTGID